MTRLAQLGAECHVAIPATGVHSRRNTQSTESRQQDLARLRADCIQAVGITGVSPDHVYFGEFSDNEMDRHSLLELVHWLEDILNRVEPEILLTHHQQCTNIDHRYCYEAAVVATRPSNRRIDVLSGEVPSSTGYRKPTAWEPNLFVEISKEQLGAKIAAMEIYSGEARPDPHPRSPEVLAALAKIRGSAAGVSLAEAFMIHHTLA